MVVRSRGKEEFLHAVQTRARAIRPKLRRSIVFVNGKGGTGKTSSCANVGASLAAILSKGGNAARVLLLEFDVQANLKSDLGVKGKSGDDGGLGILSAVMGTGALQVVRDVRPQLDLVPAGKELQKVVRLLAAASERERTEAWLNFAQSLADVAHEYEYILLDLPPGDEELQKLAMACAQWVIIPSVFDMASRYGLELVGQLFDEVEEVNDEVDVLGVLMFGFERREERLVKDKESGEVIAVKEVGQRQRIRKALEGDVARGGSDAPVLKSVIGASKVASEICRAMGWVAYELADHVASSQWTTLSKQVAIKVEGKVSITVDTAEALATDYENAALELATRVKEQEALAA